MEGFYVDFPHISCVMSVSVVGDIVFVIVIGSVGEICACLKL